MDAEALPEPSSVLCAAMPAHGHVSPLLVAARALVERGHRVRFLTGAEFADAVSKTGAHFLPLPPEAEFDADTVQQLSAERKKRVGLGRLRFDLESVFVRTLPFQAKALSAALRADPSDVLLTEPMFLGAATVLASNRSDRPRVITLGITPLLHSGADVAPFGAGLPPGSGRLARLRNRILNIIMHRGIFGPVHRRAQQVLEDCSGRSLEGFFLDWSKHSDRYLQLTVESFEYPRSDQAPGLSFIGPLHSPTDQGVSNASFDTVLPEWWSELESTTRKVVFVTQGTAANDDWSALVEPTIAAFAEKDVLLVVSLGGSGNNYPRGWEHENVRIADFLPYERLFPLVDVVVTNGGYGGVQFALRHGVPVVVAGRSEDKVEVSARVAWSGAGIDLRTDTPSAEEVRAAVERVWSESRFQETVTTISQEMAAAPGIAAVLDAVDELGRTEVGLYNPIS